MQEPKDNYHQKLDLIYAHMSQTSRLIMHQTDILESSHINDRERKREAIEQYTATLKQLQSSNEQYIELIKDNLGLEEDE